MSTQEMKKVYVEVEGGDRGKTVVTATPPATGLGRGRLGPQLLDTVRAAGGQAATKVTLVNIRHGVVCSV